MEVVLYDLGWSGGCGEQGLLCLGMGCRALPCLLDAWLEGGASGECLGMIYEEGACDSCVGRRECLGLVGVDVECLVGLPWSWTVLEGIV